MGEVIRDLFGVVTAGIADPEDGPLTTSLMGRYAEFMVCAQLCKAGYHATHVDGVGFDLVVTTDERSFTVQVKSSNVIVDGYCHWRIGKHVRSGGSGRGYYAKRPLMPSDADLLALFHHVYETTVVVPITACGISKIKLPVSQVQHASIDISLRHALTRGGWQCKDVHSATV